MSEIAPCVGRNTIKPRNEREYRAILNSRAGRNDWQRKYIPAKPGRRVAAIGNDFLAPQLKGLTNARSILDAPDSIRGTVGGSDASC